MNRFERLRAVYQGRQKQLEAAKQTGKQPEFAKAVDKYVRARKAWRAIRGWV